MAESREVIQLAEAPAWAAAAFTEAAEAEARTAAATTRLQVA
jgi:hypothetical protein